ncbi:hypothetical protein BH20VER3_BH20VER3_00450 [soil metagenome]
MSTSLRLAREQCEKAFAGYLLAKKTELGLECPLVSPVGVGVFIRKGQFDEDGNYVLQNPDEIPLPAVAVACPRATPHDMGYPVCELHLMIFTGADEESAADRASARFGFLHELFDESHTAELFAALNPPVAPDPDLRAVQNFSIFGFYLTEDMGQETGRHWIDHLVYEVHGQPTDEPDE